MARAIDADELKRWCEKIIDQACHPVTVQIGEVFLDKVRSMPTLTPPDEWVSVETPPTTQGWYHVAILDLKTGKYTVEQDLYSIELAKAHGFEPGFCKANRWEERERIDYWCRFPSPPDRRPPEGEI